MYDLQLPGGGVPSVHPSPWLTDRTAKRRKRTENTRIAEGVPLCFVYPVHQAHTGVPGIEAHRKFLYDHMAIQCTWYQVPAHLRPHLCVLHHENRHERIKHDELRTKTLSLWPTPLSLYLFGAASVSVQVISLDVFAQSSRACTSRLFRPPCLPAGDLPSWLQDHREPVMGPLLPGSRCSSVLARRRGSRRLCRHPMSNVNCAYESLLHQGVLPCILPVHRSQWRLSTQWATLLY
jgi:hypothetical protein